MTCSKYGAFFVLFFSYFSVLAQPSPIPTSPALVESSSTPKPSLIGTASTLLDNSTTLVQRLEERKTQAEAQARRWQNIIDGLIAESEKDKNLSAYYSTLLQEAEAKLEQSQTELQGISNLLAETKNSQRALSMDFGDYKKAAQAEIRSHRLAGGLWRVAALSGASCAAGFALDRSGYRGASIGAIIGAAGGAAWLVIEMLK